jgi:hypothetical protein
VIYDKRDKSLPAGDALGASDAAAGQWAKIVAGMLGEEKTDHKAWVVGFATVQNDKYLEAMEWHFPSLGSIGEAEALAAIEQWSKETRTSKLAPKCRPRSTPSSRKHVEIPPLVAAIRPHVEDRVSANVSELLEGEDGAWQEAAAEYGPMMKVIARSLSPGFTTAALQRRRDIASVLPKMPQKARSGRKEEGK